VVYLAFCRYNNRKKNEAAQQPVETSVICKDIGNTRYLPKHYIKHCQIYLSRSEHKNTVTPPKPFKSFVFKYLYGLMKIYANRVLAEGESSYNSRKLILNYTYLILQTPLQTLVTDLSPKLAPE
jgi:hypothetical protein